MYLPNTNDLAIAIDGARREALQRTMTAGRRQQHSLRTRVGSGLVRLGEHLLLGSPRARPSPR